MSRSEVPFDPEEVTQAALIIIREHQSKTITSAEEEPALMEAQRIIKDQRAISNMQKAVSEHRETQAAIREAENILDHETPPVVISQYDPTFRKLIEIKKSLRKTMLQLEKEYALNTRLGWSREIRTKIDDDYRYALIIGRDNNKGFFYQTETRSNNPNNPGELLVSTRFTTVNPVVDTGRYITTHIEKLNDGTYQSISNQPLVAIEQFSTIYNIVTPNLWQNLWQKTKIWIPFIKLKD